MKRDEIMNYLPHRGNMLLLDEVMLDGEVSHGEYTIKGGEWFLDGHFPGNPVVPGVILCEILAQSACLLLDGTCDCVPFFTGLSNVRFKTPVRVGDTLKTECRLTRTKAPFYFAEGKGLVGDKLCIKAEFSFALVKE